MKINKLLPVSLAVLLLTGCGDKPQNETDATLSAPEKTQKDKTKVSDNNVFSPQVKALQKAKEVEKLLLETSKQRLQAIDGLE